MSEKIEHSAEQQQGLTEQERAELEQLAAERRNEQLEQRSPENQESSRGEAAHEALEHARSAETEKRHDVPATHHSEREKSTPSKKDRSAAYDTIMDETRSHMSPASRTFSKFIHTPAVERSSEAVGATVARPNAILAGSASAFIVVLAVYLIARYYGYPLSGTEAIAAFAFGWILGTVFDFLRVMITGKRA